MNVERQEHEAHKGYIKDTTVIQLTYIFPRLSNLPDGRQLSTFVSPAG